MLKISGETIAMEIPGRKSLWGLLLLECGPP